MGRINASAMTARAIPVSAAATRSLRSRCRPSLESKRKSGREMRALVVGAECARALEEREGFGRSGDATVFGRSVRSWSECLGSVGVVSDETTEAEKER